SAVARAPSAHGAGEVLVDLLHAVGLLLLVLQARAFVIEPPQVGRDAAGDGLQPVAARAVLVVGRGADLDGLVVLAVGVLGAPLLAERWQLARVDGLRRHVAVRAGRAGGEGGAQRQAQQQ